MHVLRMTALVAILGVISGCASEPDVKYAQPTCPTLSEPALPAIDRGALWDALGDEHYRRVESYIDGLWSIIDQQRAALDEVCP